MVNRICYSIVIIFYSVLVKYSYELSPCGNIHLLVIFNSCNYYRKMHNFFEMASLLFYLLTNGNTIFNDICYFY